MVLLTRLWSPLLRAGAPVLSPVVRGWLRRSFGPSPLDREASRGDAGLFGPSSASWRVFGDIASFVGGVRSLLVQLTHPRAMAGVAEHSRFHDDPLGRLQRTSAHVALTTFGSTAEARASLARTRALHARVIGDDYDAAEPELLSWVSVSGTASWLAADTAFAVDPLRGASADAFVAEQALVGGLLDPRVDLERPPPFERLPLVREGWLPTTVAGIDDLMAWFQPRLAVSLEGRRTLRFLLWPNVDPVLRLGYLPILAGALGSLEPHEVELLGLPLGRAARQALRWQAEAALVALRAGTLGGSPSRRTAEARLAA